jgi:hypothetical protein
MCVLFAALFQLEPSSFAFRTFSFFPPKERHNVGLLRFDDDHDHICYRLRRFKYLAEKVMSSNHYSTKKLFNELFDVVKLSLIMSHGNATVESGFSINKQILVGNLNEHTLVCQRQVYDAIYSTGGVTNLQINDKIIKYYMSSHRNYKLFRDEEKKKVKSISKEASDKKKARSELHYLENKKKETPGGISIYVENVGS